MWNVPEKQLHRQYRCHTGKKSAIIILYSYDFGLDCCLDIDWLDDWTFASCGADNLIYVMQVDAPEPIKTFSYVGFGKLRSSDPTKLYSNSGHENEINEIRCNSTGTRLASCSDDRTARIWNIESGSIPGLLTSDHVVVLRGHGHCVNTISWCPDHPPGTNQLIATYGAWFFSSHLCSPGLSDHHSMELLVFGIRSPENA